jgi:kexin
MRSAITLFSLLLLLSSITLADVRPRTPHARSYDTHSYYALQLSPSISGTMVEGVAHSLGVELLEPIGELAGHWLVRSSGFTPSYLSPRTSSDPIVERWEHIRSLSPRDTKRHLRGLTPLVTRQRAKRIPPHRRSLRGRQDERADDSELLFAQNELHLADPMLRQQWHLINTDMKDIELNVTGLWAKGITGDGVKVVIVDDGLDLNSDDLSANFVCYHNLIIGYV